MGADAFHAKRQTGKGEDLNSGRKHKKARPHWEAARLFIQEKKHDFLEGIPKMTFHHCF